MTDQTDIVERERTCKGSVALGSGCRKCRRCCDELAAELTRLRAGGFPVYFVEVDSEAKQWQQESKAVHDFWLNSKNGRKTAVLYTDPPAPVVDDQMITRAIEAMIDEEERQFGEGKTPHNGARRNCMRAALTAALGKGESHG